MGSSGDNTVVVGLIGAGIGASFSPALHEREAALLGFDYEYRLLDLDELGRPASDVGALVREARAPACAGSTSRTRASSWWSTSSTSCRPRRPRSARSTPSCCATAARSATTPTRPASARRSSAACRARAPSTSCCSAPAGRAPRSATRCWRSGAERLSVVDVDATTARRGSPTALRAPRAAVADLGALGRGRRAHPRHADRHGRATPGARCRRSCSTRATGSPRSSTCRCAPSSCGTREERGCRTLDGGAMVALQAAGSLELFTGARPDRDRMLRPRRRRSVRHERRRSPLSA